ncbi:MAG: lipase family protein [Acidobacteriota bacterium]
MSAPVFIAGHSLGAARACLYAYSRVKRGLPVDGVYTWGCPRPGNSALGSALSSVPIWRDIRNYAGPFPDFDLVTAVPFDVEPLFDYCRVVRFENCDEAPAPNDPWGLFRYHHIQLYQAGCRKLPPTGSGAAVELVEAVDATADLYSNAGPWDWQHFVNGQYWGMRTMPTGARLLIARGSTTELDWIDDLRTVQCQIDGGAWVSEGFWAGIGPILPALDGALA